MTSADPRRPSGRFPSIRRRPDPAEVWFERLMESAAAREARDIRDLEVAEPNEAAIHAALHKLLERLIREAGEEERQIDDIARLQSVVTMLTRVPRDPLATATSYLIRQAGTLESESELATFLAETKVLADDSALRLPNLQRLVEAIHDDAALAEQRYAESEEVLDARLEEAQRIARTTRTRMRRAAKALRWTTVWPRLVRALTLFAIAMGAWWLGDVASDAVGVPQALVAVLTFLIVDVMLIDMLVEPWLVGHRRKVLRRLAQQVCDAFREVQRGIDAISGALPKSDA